MSVNPLDQLHRNAGARFSAGGPQVPAHYGDWAAEYATARERAGLTDRSWRGLIEITGKDRAAWLHNLVTNEVKNLRPGEGNYAFAVNVKGRTLFDANVLVGADLIWLDFDSRYREKIIPHLDRYVITEDVAVRDRTAEFARLAVFGPAIRDVAARVGPANAIAMAQLQHAPVAFAGIAGTAIRHDFAGLPGLEYLIPATGAAGAWHALRETLSACGGGPVGHLAVRTLRMEAGIPEFGEDIDEETIPPETGQIERGISYHKGCYLGQEVIERMRSHHVLPRRLVGLRLDAPCDAPARLLVEGNEVGRVTSACHSPRLGGPLGMGYVRTALAKIGQRLAVQCPAASGTARIIPWPAEGR